MTRAVIFNSVLTDGGGVIDTPNTSILRVCTVMIADPNVAAVEQEPFVSFTLHIIQENPPSAWSEGSKRNRQSIYKKKKKILLNRTAICKRKGMYKHIQYYVIDCQGKCGS